ncbi:macrophage migration inhibitory factor [Trichinella nativa]|uniref:L-dopachrome isomerase n=1 Tax=Trichinella nativa TaxID=6335 RepID=A0A1Y3EY53_9BILA|nr:macrophage migration inhibitory factor [Trichinella nativa]
MEFGGADDPCLIGVVRAVGRISAEENAQYAERLSEFLHQQLGILPQRLFTVSSRTNVHTVLEYGWLLRWMEWLSASVDYVAVHINTDQQLSFGGSTNPAAFGTLMSIGGIEPSRNRDHSAKLFDHLNKKLGIPKNRMYIHFVNLNGEDVGWNGTTF